MIGPCLCGDPYCPSCGNPEQAKFDDYIETFIDEVLSKLSYETLELIKEIAPILEKHHTNLINLGIDMERQAQDELKVWGE